MCKCGLVYVRNFGHLCPPPKRVKGKQLLKLGNGEEMVTSRRREKFGMEAKCPPKYKAQTAKTLISETLQRQTFVKLVISQQNIQEA